MIGPLHHHGYSRMAILSFAQNTSIAIDTINVDSEIYLCELLTPSGAFERPIEYTRSEQKNMHGKAIYNC